MYAFHMILNDEISVAVHDAEVRLLAMEGRGVKNCPKLRDVIYGRPLSCTYISTNKRLNSSSINGVVQK